MTTCRTICGYVITGEWYLTTVGVPEFLADDTACGKCEGLVVTGYGVSA